MPGLGLGQLRFKLGVPGLGLGQLRFERRAALLRLRQLGLQRTVFFLFGGQFAAHGFIFRIQRIVFLRFACQLIADCCQRLARTRQATVHNDDRCNRRREQHQQHNEPHPVFAIHTMSLLKKCRI